MRTLGMVVLVGTLMLMSGCRPASQNPDGIPDDANAVTVSVMISNAATGEILSNEMIAAIEVDALHPIPNCAQSASVDCMDHGHTTDGHPYPITKVGMMSPWDHKIYKPKGFEITISVTATARLLPGQMLECTVSDGLDEHGIVISDEKEVHVGGGDGMPDRRSTVRVRCLGVV